MEKNISEYELMVNLLTYPFSISSQNGSGVSRYNYELVQALSMNKNLRLILENYSYSENKWFDFFIRLFKSEKNIMFGKYNLIHATSPYSRFFSMRLSKRPMITSIHDVIWLDYKFKVNNKFTKMRALVNKFSIKNSDFLFVPFEYTKLKIIENFNINEEKIMIVPYGMNTESYVKVESIKLESSPKLIFLGGLNPISRGALLAIDAFFIFRKSIPDSILYFSSTNNPEFNKFKEMIDPIKLQNVRFIPFVEESQMPRFFSNFDLMLYPTDMGFSFLLIQAFAAGLPVITTNVYDLPEFLNSLEFLCRSKDPISFSEAMIEILTNKSKYKFIQKGIEKIAKDLSPNNLAYEIIKAYNLVFESKGQK